MQDLTKILKKNKTPLRLFMSAGQRKPSESPSRNRIEDSRILRSDATEPRRLYREKGHYEVHMQRGKKITIFLVPFTLNISFVPVTQTMRSVTFIFLL